MNKKTIRLKLYQNILNEYAAAGTIKPGMLVSLTSAGKVIANNSADTACEKMFATESELNGKTIDDDYVADDVVFTYVMTPGCEVLALLAVGQDASIGSKLCSNGDGTLKLGAGVPLAIALEAVDTTASSGSPVGRIKVRIL